VFQSFAGSSGFHYSLSKDDETDVNACLNLELGDEFDGRHGAHNVDDAFVHPHFEAVPSVGSISAGGASRGDHKLLGGDAHGSLRFVLQLLGLHYDFRAGLLERLHILAAKGHSDALEFLLEFFSLSFVFLGVDHFFSDKQSKLLLINNNRLANSIPNC